MKVRSLQPALNLSEWLENHSVADASECCATDEARNGRQPTTCEEWSAEKVFTLYPDSERRAQLARLEAFRLLRPGWDSYDAPPPSEVAINNVRHILHVLWTNETAPPLRQISPSVEGGVAVVFTGDDKKYADIECFNNGDILGITSDGNAEPSVWSLNKEGGNIRRAIEKLNAFFNG